MKIRIMVLASVIVILGATCGWSQVNTVLRVHIPFEFMVAGEVFPAGPYDISREAHNNALQIANVYGGPSAYSIVLENIWKGSNPTPNDYHIVFDQVGNNYIFSELWIPQSNGYRLTITKKNHKHMAVNVSQ